MARGHQKAQAQQKNLKKQEQLKKQSGHDQKAAAQNALHHKCTVCLAQMPDPKTYKQHFENKHPKAPLPVELVEVQMNGEFERPPSHRYSSGNNRENVNRKGRHQAKTNEDPIPVIPCVLELLSNARKNNLQENIEHQQKSSKRNKYNSKRNKFTQTTSSMPPPLPAIPPPLPPPSRIPIQIEFETSEDGIRRVCPSTGITDCCSRDATVIATILSLSVKLRHRKNRLVSLPDVEDPPFCSLIGIYTTRQLPIGDVLPNCSILIGEQLIQSVFPELCQSAVYFAASRGYGLEEFDYEYEEDIDEACADELNWTQHFTYLLLLSEGLVSNLDSTSGRSFPECYNIFSKHVSRLRVLFDLMSQRNDDILEAEGVIVFLKTWGDLIRHEIEVPSVQFDEFVRETCEDRSKFKKNWKILSDRRSLITRAHFTRLLKTIRPISTEVFCSQPCQFLSEVLVSLIVAQSDVQLDEWSHEIVDNAVYSLNESEWNTLLPYQKQISTLIEKIVFTPIVEDGPNRSAAEIRPLLILQLLTRSRTCVVKEVVNVILSDRRSLMLAPLLEAITQLPPHLSDVFYGRNGEDSEKGFYCCIGHCSMELCDDPFFKIKQLIYSLKNLVSSRVITADHLLLYSFLPRVSNGAHKKHASRVVVELMKSDKLKFPFTFREEIPDGILSWNDLVNGAIDLFTPITSLSTRLTDRQKYWTSMLCVLNERASQWAGDGCVRPCLNHLRSKNLEWYSEYILCRVYLPDTLGKYYTAEFPWSSIPNDSLTCNDLSPLGDIVSGHQDLSGLHSILADELKEVDNQTIGVSLEGWLKENGCNYGEEDDRIVSLKKLCKQLMRGGSISSLGSVDIEGSIPCSKEEATIVDPSEDSVIIVNNEAFDPLGTVSKKEEDDVSRTKENVPSEDVITKKEDKRTEHPGDDRKKGEVDIEKREMVEEKTERRKYKRVDKKKEEKKGDGKVDEREKKENGGRKRDDYTNDRGNMKEEKKTENVVEDNNVKETVSLKADKKKKKNNKHKNKKK